MFPCNIAAVEAFLSVASQWRSIAVGMGGTRFIGLDYAAVQAGLSLAGTTLSPGTWAEFRVIEAAACAALNGEN